jgi:hypothetical protein
VPRIHLVSYQTAHPLALSEPAGSRLVAPRVQLRCYAWLPAALMPRDAIIDTGSPYSWFPADIWTHFREGTDFEWLPFGPGVTPPATRTVGWTFTFRMARMLQPIRLFDLSAEIGRDRVVVQFADGNPPPRGQAPPSFVVGLWGGLLDDTKLVITPNPQTGSVDGVLEF